jgi:hypothetical protein
VREANGDVNWPKALLKTQHNYLICSSPRPIDIPRCVWHVETARDPLKQRHELSQVGSATGVALAKHLRGREMDVDDDEAETDEETQAIPVAGRGRAEAAQHTNDAAGLEAHHASELTKLKASPPKSRRPPDARPGS